MVCNVVLEVWYRLFPSKFFQFAFYLYLTLSVISTSRAQVCCKCCNFSVSVALNVQFTMNGMCVMNNTHILCGVSKQKDNEHGVWSLLLLAATVWSFAHLLLGLSSRNKGVLWPEYENGARYNLHKKKVRSVWFIVKRREYCCNLSVGIALKVQFTTNEMCKKSNTHIYVVQTSNNRVISWGGLRCCLLPQRDALRTCHSSFSIKAQEIYFLVFRLQWRIYAWAK